MFTIYNKEILEPDVTYPAYDEETILHDDYEEARLNTNIEVCCIKVAKTRDAAGLTGPM